MMSAVSPCVAPCQTWSRRALFAARLVNGMDGLSHQVGYSIALGRSDEDPDRALRQVERLLAEQVAGPVIVPVACQDYAEVSIAFLAVVRAARTPFVLIDRYVDGSSADTVVSDNFDGAYRSTKHLIDLGHRRIAYLGYPRCSTIDDRMAGCRKCLMDHLIRPDARLMRPYHPRRDREQTIEATKESLQLDPPVTAIFTANDGVAMDVWAGLQEMDSRVPEDVALVGYDNASGHTGPGVMLTTTEQPPFEAGRIACKMLLDRIEGFDGEARFECAESSFVPGRSTVYPSAMLVRSEVASVEADSTLS